MRSIVLLIAAVTLSAEAPAPADLQQYEQGLATLHFNQARLIVDRLIRERVPPDGKPRPDPLLNALIGRLYLFSRSPTEARIYLDHAPIADLPHAIQAATALDHGRALDLDGDRAAALAAYREAFSVSESQDERNRATIGIARELLSDDPVAVRSELLPIANGPSTPHRWEARYLLALSSSISGDKAAAQAWADQAWADVPAAPLTDLAAVRVETLRAGLAAASGDIPGERAMLTVSNGLALTASTSLAAQLPVCGDSGLRPSDFVTYGFVQGPFIMRELAPIAASRPEAIAAFQSTLQGRALMTQDDTVPAGTVFTVRCRTVVSSYFVATKPPPDPVAEWSVSRGIYLATLTSEADDEHLREIDNWIDDVSSRFGKDSPLLIMPHWQILMSLEARAAAGDPVLPGQLADLRKQISTGLLSAGASDWLVSSMDVPTPVEVLAQGSDPSSVSSIESAYRTEIVKMPFSLSRSLITGWLGKIQSDAPAQPAQIAKLILDLDARAPASLAGRERQSWKLMVAAAERTLGKDAEAHATLLAAGLPKDICAADDADPALLEQHFSEKDYPEELMMGEQEGAVLFEFGLSPTGSPSHPRVLYSLPSGIFDQASGRGLETVRYTSPQRGGRAVACEDVTQPIRWQLQGEANLQMPTIAPQSPGPTT